MSIDESDLPLLVGTLVAVLCLLGAFIVGAA